MPQLAYSSDRFQRVRVMPLRVLLADDHDVFRGSLKAFLKREGIAVVGEAADGLEALKKAGKIRPDVAILDLAMPLLSGLDAAREIARTSPGTRTIILTTHSETHYVVQAFRAGVAGYVLKRRAPEELLPAIGAVAGGKTYLCTGFPPAILQGLVNDAAA